MPLCPRCGQDNPDVARFCLACGTPLAPPEPVVEERKLITVLFCDIVGSTAKAEQLDPEDVRARLAPYYERARTELERFGGTVEKFIGDAVVALFGAPVAHEDDPERAVRAALAVRDAVEKLNEEDAWLDLKIRVGVNTGEALVVLGARTTEGEGMASGDVMNTAARLQSAAPVNGIVVGEATHRATREAIDYRQGEESARPDLGGRWDQPGRAGTRLARSARRAKRAARQGATPLGCGAPRQPGRRDGGRGTGDREEPLVARAHGDSAP
jgi:class 3 adenylate cyclase